MKSRFRLRLFLKVALLMVGLATVPLSIVGVQTLLSNREILQYEVLRYHQSLAQSLSNKLDAQLANMEEKLRFIVNFLQSPDSSWQEKQTLLQSVVDASPQLAIIAVVAQDGNEFIKVYSPSREPTLAAFPTLSSHADIPLFKKFMTSKERVFEVSGETEDPRFKAYYPFETSTGRHAIFISNSLDNFWKEITNTHIGVSGFAFLADKDGLVLAHPDSAKTAQKTSVRSMPLVSSALAGNIGASEFADTAGKWVGAGAPVRRLGGAVVTLQPRDEAYAAAQKSQRTAVLWLIVSAIIAAILAYVFARRLTRPILSLIKSARTFNLETGRFPDPVIVKTNDEIRDLAETFNSMTQELKNYAALQVERMLAEKTKTEAIVFSISDGLIMTDHQGFIEFINHRARQILDITTDYQSLLKKPLWDFLPHTEVLDVLWDITHNPEQKNLEMDLTSTGLRRVFAVSSEQVRTPKGEDIGIVIILHDITLEKEIEQMKDDFLHSITHDLRNPMASIRGFLKFLMDGLGGPVTEQQKKMLETMDRASMRLLGMINDILDVAKLESGKMDLNLSETDLQETSKHVLELLQSQASKKNIQLLIDSPPDLPTVQADPLLMERLLTNLVGNALKFTPEKGKVTIELRDEPNRLCGAVVDTGEGIPPEFVDKIFDKFQQVTGQRKGGTGLGLTICRYIVESHKGKIAATSEVGKGSRFHFWLSKGLMKTPSGEVVIGAAAAAEKPA
ncbi:MAG TPA: ATP-binding protein [Elusimicrobiota bacterium]|nr:ATP-binding protein [Elusimicrobiota bacterium]